MHAKPEEILVLMTKARHDLTAAQVMLDQELPDIVCFHAQQAVEKCLKALLLTHNLPYPFRHDLGELLALLPEVPLPFRDLENDLKKLTPFATIERYENLLEPDAETAVAAVSLAELVYRTVRHIADGSPEAT